MEAFDRAKVPARRYRVPGRSNDCRDADEDDPERDRQPHEGEPRQDREAADDDDRQRQCECRRHRAPPEVQRLHSTRPEQQEAQDEPEVRRVEDVAPAEPDHVLRQQRNRCRPREDPPPLRAPPVAVLCARHPEDECDAVPGEERARRPDERVLPSKDDPELEHGTRADGDEDLRDRETEVERDLAEDLERDDDRSQVQTRVANARQDDRIRLPTDREPALGSERRPARSRAPAQAVRAHLSSRTLGR